MKKHTAHPSHKVHREIKKKRINLFLICGISLVLALFVFWGYENKHITQSENTIKSSNEKSADDYEEPPPEEYPEATIKIINGKFVPDRLEVKAGTLINFENEDKTSYVVISDNYGDENEVYFETKVLRQKQIVPTVEYGIPGQYPYHDKANSEMRGVIIIK